MDIIPKQNRSLKYITVPDDRRSSNGQQKGIIARIKCKGDKIYSYLYPPFLDNTENQIKWLDMKQVTNQFVYFELIFWQIHITSNCIVFRDKKWFDTVVAPKVLNFWEEVKLRRKIGCDDLLPRKLKVLDLSFKKKQEFLFVDSDED